MAKLPKPIPGLVIRYSYLWAREYDLGRDEGRKDRPCAIVLSAQTSLETTTVVVLPVTHRPPDRDTPAMEVPHATKRRLGLDDGRSWVVLSEANQFTWPGFDLRPSVPGDAASVAYGELPANFFRDLRAAFARAYRSRRARMVPRSD